MTMARVRMKVAEVREYGPLWRDLRVEYPRVREEPNFCGFG